MYQDAIEESKNEENLSEPDCLICEGYGWILVPELPIPNPNYGEARPCDCTRTKVNYDQPN